MWTKKLALVIGYLVVHILLSIISAKLEVGPNISIWHLPSGLLFAGLLLAHPPFRSTVLIADILARSIWSIGLWLPHDPIGFSIALLMSPLTYFGVTAFIRSRVPSPFDLSRKATLLILGMMAAPAIAAPLNVVNLTSGGFLPGNAMGSLIVSFWVGDAIGVITLAPLFMLLARRWIAPNVPATQGAKASTIEAVGLAMAGTALFTSAGLFDQSSAASASKFLTLVPLAAAAVRRGTTGVAITVPLLNLFVVMFLATAKPAIDVLDTQLAMLAYSSFSLFLGSYVTKERQHLSDIREYANQNAILAAAVEATPLGVVITNATDPLMIRYANSSFSQILNGCDSVLVGKNLMDLFTTNTDDTNQKPLHDLWTKIRKCGHAEAELVFTRADSESRHCTVTFASITQSEGGRVCVGILADVTERRLREQAERQKERLVSLGQLAGGVAHEINNLLHPIINLAKEAESELGSSNAEIRELLRCIHQSGQQAGEIVEKVLSFARDSSKVPRTPIRFDEAVQSAVELNRRAIPRSINVETVLGGDGVLALVHPTEVAQIVTNLIVNATQALDGNGHIVITLDTLSGGEGDVVPPGQYLRLRIADDGPGMDEEMAKRIFDPFFTTKAIGQGTGLGLSVVYGIVQDWQGHIAVQSMPGQGTEFTIHIPVYNPDVES